ncbi:MAG: GFA family protein [Sphaerochaetaceae bacterium]|nr:GFA family protein [Sphaerochaetaceae bacterium]
MKHTGSCLCGSVTFTVEGDFDAFYLCHCSRCRKDTGSAHASNLFSSSAHLHWLTGEHLVRTYRVDRTEHSKSFCAHCGSALPTVQMDGTLLVVPAGSLDTEISIEASAHIFTGSRATWDEGLEKIPHFKEGPHIKEEMTT